MRIGFNTCTSFAVDTVYATAHLHMYYHCSLALGCVPKNVPETAGISKQITETTSSPPQTACQSPYFDTSTASQTVKTTILGSDH